MTQQHTIVRTALGATCLLLSISIPFCMPIGAADNTPPGERHALAARLLAERTRVLQNDPNAVRLRQQIAELYRQLDALANKDPAVTKLRQQLQRLDQQTQPTQPPAKQDTDHHAKPRGEKTD